LASSDFFLNPTPTTDIYTLSLHDALPILFTDVRVFQESEQEGLLELLTSELRIKASQQYAETDKAVKMRAQQGHLDTLGMKAYLGEDRIELLSRVRGTYEPQ